MTMALEVRLRLAKFKVQYNCLFFYKKKKMLKIILTKNYAPKTTMRGSEGLRGFR